MQWQGSIEFKKAITLNGKPHGVVYYQTTPELSSIVQGQVIYVEDLDVLYYRGLNQFIELTPSATTHNHDQMYYTETEINGMFNTSTGHDHDGTDSKKVSFTSLDNIPADFLATVHDNSRHSAAYLTKENVTYSMLDGNSLIGSGATQISVGNHNHDLIYSKQTDLSAYTGASLIGVNSILSQSTLDSALSSIVTKFSDYRLVSESYAKSEIESNYYTKSTIDTNIYTKTQTDTNFYKKTDVYTKTELSESGSSTIAWGNLDSVPTSFTPSTHNHDSSYYTKALSDTTFALATHDHNSSYYTKSVIDSSYYKKTDLQNQGSSQVNWKNLTSVPDYINDKIAYNIVSSDGTYEVGFGVLFADNSLKEIIYDNTENLFKIKRTIGETATYEHLAVRDDTMTANALCYWNATEKQIKSSSVTVSGSTISGNIAWSNISSKPTTLSGFGITDAATSTHNHNYAGSSAPGGSATSAAQLANSIKLSLGGDLTGQVSFNGSSDFSLNANLIESITAGTFRSVLVNNKGLVTAGSNPTTLSGYGITDTYTKTEVASLTDTLILNIINSYPGTVGTKSIVNPISGNTIIKTV